MLDDCAGVVQLVMCSVVAYDSKPMKYHFISAEQTIAVYEAFIVSLIKNVRTLVGAILYHTDAVTLFLLDSLQCLSTLAV